MKLIIATFLLVLAFTGLALWATYPDPVPVSPALAYGLFEQLPVVGVIRLDSDNLVYVYCDSKRGNLIYAPERRLTGGFHIVHAPEMCK